MALTATHSISMTISMATSEDIMDKMPEGFQPMIRSIADYLESGEYSDLQIRCDESAWELHRVIVCSQSKTLADTCRGNWKEAKGRSIFLDNDIPDVVNAAIQFMYTSVYDDTQGQRNRIEPAEFNVHVLILADRWQMAPLAKLAAQKFATHANVCWNTPGFASAIRLLYEEGPETDYGTRNTAIAVSTLHAKELLSDDHGGHFRTVMREVAEFREVLSLNIKESERGLPPGDCLYVCARNKQVFYKDEALRLGFMGFKCPACGIVFDEMSDNHYRIENLPVSGLGSSSLIKGV